MKKDIFQTIFHGTSFYILLSVLIAGIFFSFAVYSSEKNIKIKAKGTEEVSKGSKVHLLFSSEVIKGSIEDGLQISPDLKIQTKWINDKELEIIPQETTIPNTEYQISFVGAKTSWFVLFSESVTTVFRSPMVPSVKKIVPVNNATDVDYSQNLIVDFNRPLAKDFALEVTINPLTGFEHQLSEDRKRLVIKPVEPMKKETEYQWEIKVKHKEQTDFEEIIYQGTFMTKVPPKLTYNLDKNGNPTKTEERPEEVLPQITEGKYIDIDLSSQALLIFQDGKELGAFKVSTGKRGMDTPIGTHQIISKSRRPWSAKYKLYMPWFIQFTYQGHGIHELPEWPGGYKEGANHLGIPVSHGCVRLGIGPAKVVYDFVEKGTPLVIHQ